MIIGLGYLATNAHQEVLAATVKVSQKTVSNSMKKFVKALNRPFIVRKFVECRLNDLAYRRRKAERFARLGLLPNIVGAIDGCLMPVVRPAH